MTTSQDIASGKVQFIQNHQTALNAGKYKIDINQTVTINNQNPKTKDQQGKEIDQPLFTSSLIFVVTGDPFELNPQDIHTVFPPAGSSGDHAHVLPHIVLKRSTLPWEMNAQTGEEIAPWLALLVIHEEETQGERPSVLPIRTLTLDKLNSVIDGQDLYEKEEDTSSNKIGKLYFPGLNYTSDSDFSAQTGHYFTDKVSVLDIKKGLLQTILPSLDDLRYLAHVRQNTDDQEQPIKDNEENIIDEPLSTIIANRLPKQNGTSTVYLVSLQNRYGEDRLFNYQTENNEHYIRFITLKSWSFSCQNSGPDFLGLLKKLEVDTLKLPPRNQADADKFLQKGYILLPHSLRQGGKTFSWYHSPLLPAKNKSLSSLANIPIRCADQLIAYDENYGLFDISYAAAWQLGQLLALQDQKFAISLFNWKRAKALESKQKDQMNNGQDSLALLAQSINVELPKTVATWLEQLRLLKNVPFNYLVPNEQMLPKESICFFWLDWFWVESLLDGAFSIGRVQESDATWDNDNNPLKNKDKVITGFLLRSEVVAGWPDLQIEGFDEKQNKLGLRRGDRLSTDVMICLFDGVINQVDISLKPKGLNFGFEPDYTLKLRDTKEGTEHDGWKTNGKYILNNRVVNLGLLIKKITEVLNNNQQKIEKEDFTSEDLALQLIQGAKKVQFKLKS